jgi:predicted N-acyltransferase
MRDGRLGEMLRRHDHQSDLRDGTVEIFSRADLARCSHWQRAFQGHRKDYRFYGLVEDTILQGFEYRYFAIKDKHGAVQAIQPFFILDQDVLAGVGLWVSKIVAHLRRVWPRLLKMRTLMVGCVVGEGCLDGQESSYHSTAVLLGSVLLTHARDMKVSLIVFKEFPARYRDQLECLRSYGFSRVPSLPMTKLNIDYPSFDAYMATALNSATRRKLKRKFSAAAAAVAIELMVICDVTSIIDEIFPLYLQVYNRSKLHFEKLTPAFFCGLGRLMPEKVRFFIWRQDSRIIAFTMCMVQGDTIYTEYIGLDYSLALDLHLYHYAIRDMISWAISHGYTCLRSSGLNYDPKLHLRHLLDPTDLYVRHSSKIANFILKQFLPLMEPTRYDPILKKFSNYAELRGSP